MAEMKAPPRSTTDNVTNWANVKFGKNTIISPIQMEYYTPRLQTGIFILTYASGGGWPVWRFTRLKGPESGGKTTGAITTMKVAAMTCWRCLNVEDYCTCGKEPLKRKSAFLDAEGTLEKAWVHAIGVPDDSWIYVQAGDGGEYLEIAKQLLRADDCGLVILDSFGALLPPDETDRAIGDRKVGSIPQLMSDAANKIVPELSRRSRLGSYCLFLGINQISYKVGQMFGDPETEPGGQKLKHWRAFGVRMTKIASDEEKYKDKERSLKLAQKHRFKIDKEKMWIHQGEGEYFRVKDNVVKDGELVLASGMIDDFKTVLTYAERHGLLTKDKGTYSLLDQTAKTQVDMIGLLMNNEPFYYQCHKAITDVIVDARFGPRTP